MYFFWCCGFRFTCKTVTHWECFGDMCEMKPTPWPGLPSLPLSRAAGDAHRGDCPRATGKAGAGHSSRRGRGRADGGRGWGWNPARGRRGRGTARGSWKKGVQVAGPFTWSPARKGLCQWLRPGGPSEDPEVRTEAQRGPRGERTCPSSRALLQASGSRGVPPCSRLCAGPAAWW